MPQNPITRLLSQTEAQQSQSNQTATNLSMVEQFAQFKNQMKGKDPKAIVQNMLQTGQMTQEQFQYIARQADALKSILK